MIHIGDAPCHGSRFYDKANDNHPDSDKRPNGEKLNITDILSKLKEKNVAYFFAELKDTTRIMIKEFNKELVKLGGNRIVVGRLPSGQGVTKLVIDSLIRTIMESKSASYLNDKPKEKNIEIDVTPIDTFKWDPKEMIKHDATYKIAKFTGQIPDIQHKRVEFDDQNCELWMGRDYFL